MLLCHFSKIILSRIYLFYHYSLHSWHLQHSFSNFQTNGSAQWRGHSIANFTMSILQGSSKLVRVRKSLTPGQFSHTQDPVLFRMKNLSLLTNRLWICDGCFEISIPRSSSKTFLPMVMTICSVTARPWYYCVTLLVILITKVLVTTKIATTNTFGTISLVVGVV